jgi:hypothetical protein
MSSGVYFKWPALESDPYIFNSYFHEIGLPEVYGFEELICLDYKEIDCNINELPIFGIIAAINRKGVNYIDNVILDPSAIPFYIRQSKDLDHACGLIAGLHCIGNSPIDQCDNSILKTFFTMVKGKPEETKTKILETYNDLKTKYTVYSQLGQTQAEQSEESEVQSQQNVQRIPIHHFVSFCNVEGRLIELDGTLKGPVVIRESVQPHEFLDCTVDEIKKRISQGLISDNISMMYLTYI